MLRLFSNLCSVSAVLAASQIYLAPFQEGSSSTIPSISSGSAHALLSHHLALSSYDLELSELPSWHQPDPFQQSQAALILLVQKGSSDPNAYAPTSFDRPSFQVESTVFDHWHSLITLYLQRFSHSLGIHLSEIHGWQSFISSSQDLLASLRDWTLETLHLDDIIHVPVDPVRKTEYVRLLTEFDLSHESMQPMIDDFVSIDQLVEGLDRTEEKTPIAALRLTGLQAIERIHGAQSIQFKLASEYHSRFLDAAIEAFRQHSHPQAKVVLIISEQSGAHTRTPSLDIFKPSARLQKRQTVDSQFQRVPIVPISRPCYDSADSCTNATNACSGHGQCVSGIQSGRSACFVCSCSKINGTQFSGNVCQKQDVSSTFFVILGTVVLLFLVVGSSISLLVSGSDDLPQVLQLSSKLD